MRLRRRLVRCALAAVVLLAGPAAAQDQAGALISRAIDHENAGRYQEALAAWRAAIDAGAVLPGVLGLERTYSMMGDEAELLPLLDSLLPRYPTEPQLRGAQLRTLIALGREGEARTAFANWRDARPGDATPYRDFARILLYNNRTATADSVLAEAVAALGTTRAILLESAQLRAALGRWREAAEAWRETMRDQAYFESAAVFSLGGAPPEARDQVREELVASDAPIGARQALASLELGWGAPRDGWRVLAALPASDTVVAVWRAFAEEAERAQAWGAASDALAAVYRARREPKAAERGAAAALRANNPELALELARAARSEGEAAPRPEVLAVELDALAQLGRAADAERTLANAGLSGAAARPFARTIAWAWIRAGNVARARAALVDAPLDAEDAVAGWLALFDGELATARRALRSGDVAAREAVAALALLSRTTATSSPSVGQAFLALAQGDTTAAVAGYLQAARELQDAAPLLLTMAARLETARGADRRAVPLWQRVTAEHATSPEAAEAYLEWARALARGGDRDGARARYETLILTFPGSALVPQARRELDALARPRGGLQ